MLTLFETIRRIAREELARLRTAELAVVQEQHPHADASDSDNYACTVRLRDTGLVLSKVPVATGRIGAASIPGVGDLVLVQYIGADAHSPVITARFYNEEDRPPANTDGQAVLHLPPGAGDADAVHFELTSTERREVLFTLGGGLSVKLLDDDPVVELSIDGGKATIRIDRDGAVSIESQGALTIKGAEVSLEGDAITVEASGELTLKGATVKIN